MQIIVAVDSKWGIGKKNDLLFSLKEDMKYFREKTESDFPPLESGLIQVMFWDFCF